MTTQKPAARCIAFYAPLFFPFPENDTWWEKGFTEWSLVQGSRPLFAGHNQPRVPAESLGYYDPRQSEIRKKQATLAEDAGIEAFCYWHMWFGDGKQLLHEVVNEVMKTGVPDMPFCLTWANQTWTRTWARSGTKGEVLMEQMYPGEEDDRAHFAHVLPMFLDPRYVRVNEQPVFMLYRPFAIPDVEKFMALWNSLAHAAGLRGIFFIGMISPDAPAPDIQGLQGFIRNQPKTDLMRYGTHVLKRAVKGHIRPLFRCIRGMLRRPQVFEHSDIMKAVLSATLADKEFPQVLANWDDTPRQGKGGTVVRGSRPEFLEATLNHAVSQLASRPPEARLVFLKSWNEWGEGNYVEPDTVSGDHYLQAIRSALHHD